MKYIKKGYLHLLYGRREINRFIFDNSATFPVEKMCKVFQVSRSGYYEYRPGSVSKRAQENEKLLVLIKDVHQKSK